MLTAHTLYKTLNASRVKVYSSPEMRKEVSQKSEETWSSFRSAHRFSFLFSWNRIHAYSMIHRSCLSPRLFPWHQLIRDIHAVMSDITSCCVYWQQPMGTEDLFSADRSRHTCERGVYRKESRWFCVSAWEIVDFWRKFTSSSCVMTDSSQQLIQDRFLIPSSHIMIRVSLRLKVVYQFGFVEY